MASAAFITRGSAGPGRAGLRGCVLIALLSVTSFAACNGKNPAAPSSTTNSSTPSGATYSITGTVRAGGAPIQGARVEAVSAPNAGRSATTDPGGRYLLNNLQAGSVALQVSAPGYAMQTSTVSLGSDQVADFSLPASGQPLVGGRVIDALTQVGLGGVAVVGDGVSCSTDANGQFSLASAPGAFPKAVSFTRSGFLERQTWVHDSGQPTVSMIPANLNLRAFDEMLRAPVLKRWREAPVLVIESRALQYVDLNATSATGIDDAMADAEFSSVRGDLEWALTKLSGGTFSGFRSVTRQNSAAGGSIPLLNQGQITVVRMAGLTQATGYWGYGRFMSQSDGAVVAGLVVLDRDFERSNSQYRRSLRAHELGHAMGYAHVSAMASVMDPSGRQEPTSFDLDAFRIAFQRQPGNRAPDVDPDPAMAPMSTTRGAAWSPAIK